MKTKTEMILYHLLWAAEFAARPSIIRLGNTFEEWVCYGGFVRQIRELERRGLVEEQEAGQGTERVMRLTEEGLLRAIGGCNPDERWNREWDGSWRMVVFDLPETERKLRARLRRELLAANFGCLQGSVWITPDALEPVLPSLGKNEITGGTMVFFSGRPCGGESDADMVKAAWNFEAIGAAYDAHRSHLKAMPNKGPDARRQLFAWGEAERRLWAQCLRLDPLLPRSLWPAKYPGEQALQDRFEAIRSAGKLIFGS
jgi:phenylacetic acid degradation operon negative regulatory protein